MAMIKDENTRNTETLGHIEGLLEGYGVEWDRMDKMTDTQKYRIIELFRLLDQKWIINQMVNGYPSDVKLLTKLAEL